jgi:inosine-uridine nucleoside N-ribohydrolase
VDLIVETDCGHDPDDFFTLCYLMAAGVNLRCITVTPGDSRCHAVAHYSGYNCLKSRGLEV